MAGPRLRHGQESYVLPKIPQFGPAAQLDPQVLVPRVGEVGTIASDREQLPRFKSATPRTPRPVKPLPSIQPSAGGTGHGPSASLPRPGRSWAACRPGVAKGRGHCATTQKPATGWVAAPSVSGLTALGYKSDHTHHFHGVFPEDQEDACRSFSASRLGQPSSFCGAAACMEPAPDGAVAAQFAGGARADPCSGTPHARARPHCHAQQLSPDQHLDGTENDVLSADLSSRGEQPTRSTVRPAKPTGSTAKSSVHSKSRDLQPEAAVRCARLKASFRLDAAKIEETLGSLHAWPKATQLQPELQDRDPGIKGLTEALDCAGLEDMKLRPWRLPHDEIQEMPMGVDGDLYGKATPREISCCMAGLNFIRWLCGLLPVSTASEKCQATDILSQALLPRESAAPQLNKDVARLGSLLSEFVEQNRNCMSVLHCEGSLVAAVEQGLGATHMFRLPRGLTDCSREVAQELAANGTGEAHSHGDQAEAVQDVLASDKLPPALGPLRVFWELQSQEMTPLAPSVRFPAPPQGQPPMASKVATAMSAPQSAPARSPTSPRRLAKVGVAESIAQAWDEGISLGGLSSVWGDRFGALRIRRCLLDPALREFGAARRHDTCVLWTGASAAREGVKVPEAVCYPPAGFLPLALLQYGRVPWTVAPNSARYQPTADTRVQMWRVRIERPVGKEWTAERLAEVPIRGFTMDCTTCGEPFCVIFWPDIVQYADGNQLEVVLSGLCGAKSELGFFYEVRSFTQRLLDSSLLAEAGRVREAFGLRSLWGPPHERVFEAMRHPSLGSLHSPRAGRRLSQRLSNILMESNPLPMETISHHKTCITADTVDLAMVLRCPLAATICAQLFLVHYGGEQEEVQNAVQVHKLGGQHFILFAKFPMGRRQYELRFQASLTESPEEMVPHPMHYTVMTTEVCPSLLTSLEDCNAPKFGYARIAPLAQLCGVVVLAPRRRRVAVGQCHFLVYVDGAGALEMARGAMAAGGGCPAQEDGPGVGGPGTPASSRLFSQRLLPSEPGDGPARARGPAADLHKSMRGVLSPYVQDVDGELHLDISLNNGECVYRLRERGDLPGLFEGLVTLSAVDASHMVSLTLRFPRAHGGEFAPRAICEWLVCRSSEHLPDSF